MHHHTADSVLHLLLMVWDIHLKDELWSTTTVLPCSYVWLLRCISFLLFLSGFPGVCFTCYLHYDDAIVCSFGIPHLTFSGLCPCSLLLFFSSFCFSSSSSLQKCHQQWVLPRNIEPSLSCMLSSSSLSSFCQGGVQNTTEDQHELVSAPFHWSTHSI